MGIKKKRKQLTKLWKTMESNLPSAPPSSPYKSAPIEYLPTEIKIEILSQLPDLASLRDLVKASPHFHSVYLFDRRRILRHLLARTTPRPIFLEVLSLAALRRAADCDSLPLKDEVKILGLAKGFLNTYDELRGLSQEFVENVRETTQKVGADVEVEEKEEVEKRSINGVTFTYSKGDGLSAQFAALLLDELLAVVRQHFIVRAMTEDIVRSCLRLNPFTGKRHRGKSNDHESGSGGGSDDGILPLSRSETCRIYRALYRLELLAVMHTRWGVRYPNHHIAFLNFLSPWEIEEIHCIRNYMYQIFLTSSSETSASSNNSVLDCQVRVINSNKARCERRGRASGVGIGIGGPDVDDDVYFDLAVDDQREQYLARGLEFLWRWFQASDQYESSPVTKHITSTDVNNSLMDPSQHRKINPSISAIESNPTSASFFLTRALNPNIVGVFRPVRASETFTSDADWSRPNLGWAWLHKKNSKYLCQMHNCYNRKWGYVFWDQKRLTQMGMTEEMRMEYAPFVD
ncbi:hypothetical protein BDBG_08610 [Blastomyces gilchristii SLH14081]|uniref:F-box domain-containing protein n=1 Tax=Blastomyces gilchristii (strain SLH14081) TaxID=559298 RepID=A0A179UZA9_BLAGS|nr:uncharacterized protein BDBG_08610 [Blastomyces gilchristii SLH14081]OAT13405.1 hypothetical protein BDBG_08610 [Blastomyces gilchristii SLH14081]